MVDSYWCTYKGGFCDKEVATCATCVFAMEANCDSEEE